MMFHKAFSLGMLALVAGAVLSCQKTCPDPDTCYTGRVIGFTATNGVLIDVDPAQAIGAIARGQVTPGGHVVVVPDTLNTVLGYNIIAAVNSCEFPTAATVGRTLHFSAVPASAAPSPCITIALYDPVQGNVPGLSLRNVSDTPCSEAVQ